MLNCRDATRLMSDAQERPLGWRERISLRLHLAMCSACRAFGSQLGTLRAALRRYAGSGRPGE
jgi:predicted anti-sigma-YlaC factor YlaD